MEDKFFKEYEKKHTVVSKRFKAGIITACALLGVGFVTTGTLYGISIANKKDGGSSEKVKELENKIIELDKQITVKETEIKEKTEQIKTKEAEIETKKEEIVKKEAIIKDLEGKGAEYEKTIADLKNQITDANKKITELENSVKTLQAYLATAQAEVEKAKEEIKALNEKLKDAEAEAGKVVVMFVGNDFSNKGSFKIAKDTTFEAAELSSKVPTSTDGYVWKDFDAKTTTFSTHTLIHEIRSVPVSYDTASATALNLEFKKTGTQLTQDTPVSFTINNTDKSSAVTFNLVAKVDDGEVYRVDNQTIDAEQSKDYIINSSDITGFSELAIGKSIVFSVSQKASTTLPLTYDGQTNDYGSVTFDSACPESIEKTATSLTVDFTYTKTSKGSCYIKLFGYVDGAEKELLVQLITSAGTQSYTFDLTKSETKISECTKLIVRGIPQE